MKTKTNDLPPQPKKVNPIMDNKVLIALFVAAVVVATGLVYALLLGTGVLHSTPSENYLVPYEANMTRHDSTPVLLTGIITVNGHAIKQAEVSASPSGEYIVTSPGVMLSAHGEYLNSSITLNPVVRNDSTYTVSVPKDSKIWFDAYVLNANTNLSEPIPVYTFGPIILKNNSEMKLRITSDEAAMPSITV